MRYDFATRVMYRDYAVERLSAMTGRLWLGATIATVAFGAAHIPYWGLGTALAADPPVGAVLVLGYLRRHDLLATMLAHSAALIVAFFTTVPRAVCQVSAPDLARLHVAKRVSAIVGRNNVCEKRTLKSIVLCCQWSARSRGHEFRS